VKTPLHKQPLLILCVCFILGIFCQDFFLLKLNTIYILLILSFLTLIIFLFNGFYFYRLRPISLFLLFFSLGIFAHHLNSEKPKLPNLAGKENILFKITKKLNSNEKNRRYEIDAWKGNEMFKSVLSLPKSDVELDYLHYYKAAVYINKIEKPYSDFQFDYGKYLARKKIYFQSYLPNAFESGERNDLSFSEKIRQKRLETLHKIDLAKLSKPAREFTKGIILADRTEMDKDVVQDFSKSGLVHILAISGSHMAIIFWLILKILNPLFPPRFRNGKIIISLLLIWTFAVFIDYGSSVMRSCIMISAYYIFTLLQRKSDLLHSMAVAAFVILIADTNQLFDVGFQLSFLAVFGIFWFNQPLLKYLPKPKNTFQEKLFSIISISISAQLATFPLVIYYFHQYSFISIIANLVVIPFSEFLIIFSLLMTFLIGFSLQFPLLNLLFDAAVTYTLKVIHFFAEVDFAFYKMIPMTLLEVVVAFIILYFVRFTLVKFNLKNILRATYFVLIFIALRFLLNFKAAEMKEVLEHQYYKEKIISVKSGSKVQFMMKENADQLKIQKYIIEPYLTSRRARDFVVLKIPNTTSKININGKIYDMNH